MSEKAVHLDLARDTFKGLLALDRPIGQIMETIRGLEDSSEKAAIKESCSTLLKIQLELIERLTSVHPELREDIDLP